MSDVRPIDAHARSPEIDLSIRAAWLYYVHGLGQEEVARRLNLSRSKVTRLLSQAREAGFVKVSVEHETVESLALADWISNHFGVEEVILTPFARPEIADRAAADRAGRQAVGIVAANHIARRLQAAGRITVGLGWGRTVSEMITALPALSKPDLTLVSLLGASSNDDGSGSYSLALKFAGATGGRAHTFAAPLIVDDPAVAALLRQDGAIRETLAIAADSDFHILGVGDVSMDNLYFAAAGLGSETIRGLKEVGAVCEIAGRFLDRNGRPAATRLNDRTLGIDHETLVAADVIVLAAGRRKAEPLEALLKAGIPRTIIIDDEVAQALAERAARRGEPAPASA